MFLRINQFAGNLYMRLIFGNRFINILSVQLPLTATRNQILLIDNAILI